MVLHLELKATLDESGNSKADDMICNDKMTPYELGGSGSAEAIPYLARYLESGVTNEKRLAASAVGKLARKHRDACFPLASLLLTNLSDEGAQVRQYTLKALLALNLSYNEAAQELIRGIAVNDPAEYNRVLAQEIAGKFGRDDSVPVQEQKPDSVEKSEPFVLTGEQRRVLTLPPENPIQIKGVAGSGKTTVSIFRAVHLLDTRSDWFEATNIMVFSYTKSLVSFINSVIKDSMGRSGINVSTFHSWAYSFLTKHGHISEYSDVISGPPQESIIDATIMDAIDKFPNSALLDRPTQFFTEEIAWIKGKGIASKSEYLDAPRVGRGTGVTRDGREIIWYIFDRYQKELLNRGKIDFNDYALLADKIIENSTDFTPPFTHIVVDEAQDLSKMEIAVIAKLVSAKTQSITIVADAAQKIYKSGFSWSEVGINVRGGRTIEFKRNYRNSYEIAEAAYSLLRHDIRPDELTAPIAPTRHGKKPELHHLGDDASQFSTLSKMLQSVDINKQSVAVLHRFRKRLSTYKERLKDALGLRGTIIEGNNNRISSSGLYFCTMQSVKGLEFDVIIIVDFNDRLFPNPRGFTDPDDVEHLNTERRLLYTAMTRAKESLYILSSDSTPSRYANEIDADKITIYENEW